MDQLLPENDFYASLPRKRCSAGALFFNAQRQLLLVKPVYKDHWSIPGGVVNADESPLAACLREIKEEIGIENKILKFACVDYKNEFNYKGDALHFLFDGGVLTQDEISGLTITDEEIEAFAFYDVQQATTMVSQALGRRLKNLFDRADMTAMTYQENGDLPAAG